MDWSKTKTIFIIVFLILDVFLLYQYVEKKDDNQYAFITETSTIELLKLEEITYEKPPNEKLSEKYLIARSRNFKESDLKKLSGQDVTIADQDRLVGVFKKRTKINTDKIQTNEMDKFLGENVLHGDEYHFWSYEKKNKQIIFYQFVDSNMMFYNNSKGKVTLYLDDKGKIVSYEQTYLEGIEPYQDEKELIPAEKAIETLYLNGDIAPKSHITDMKLGYYNTLQSSTVSQLLVPTWRIVVNNKIDLFVNAFDMEPIELNTEEKILE